MFTKKVSLGVLLSALAGIYITQVMITTIAMQSLPVLLRQAGASLQFVGLSALFMLPWALRFLWAPAVERWRLPAGTVQRRSRTLILRGQWLLAAGMAVVAFAGVAGYVSLAEQGSFLLALFFLAALLSASVDIACGGFAVDQLAQGRRSLGNMAKVGGSYVGMLLGSSIFLLLAGRYGWAWALGCAGLVIVVLTLPLLSLQEPAREQPGDAQTRPSLMQSWRRPQVRLGLLLAFLLGAGVRTAVVMVGPLLVDKGTSNTDLAWIFGAFSVGAGLAGTLLGGLLMRWLSNWTAVTVSVALQALILLALALSADRVSVSSLVLMSGLLFVAMACGFVTIYSSLMGLTNPSQPGVDWALFQCADALMAMLGGLLGGALAERWGYGMCFLLAAVLAACACLLVVKCRPAQG